MLQLLLGAAPGGGPSGAKMVFHGTPHEFAPVPGNPLGKFDLAKIGTGEGAQAYGHGIYLAENPGVASSYKTVGIPTFTHTASGKPISSGLSTKLQSAWRDLHGSTHGPGPAGVHSAVLDNLNRVRQSALKAQDFDLYSWASDMQSELDHVMRDYPKVGGRVLTVHLPDEHIARMLDWDALVQNQPHIMEAANKIAQRPGIHPEEYLTQRPHFTGEDFYAGLAEHLGGPGEGGPRASQRLRALYGTPGIKYFDQGSRAAGQGTRNYVIFNPDILRIIGAE